MVGSISPMVHGAGPSRGMLLISVYLVGLAAGGALVGGAAAALGAALLPPVGSGMVVKAIVTAQGFFVLREAGVVRVPLPQMRWAVPRRWRQTMPRWRVLGAYGLLLGTGVATRIPSSSFYALLIWALVGGSAGWAVAWFVMFGLGRAVPVLARLVLDGIGLDGAELVTRSIGAEAGVKLLMASLTSVALALALATY